VANPMEHNGDDFFGIFAGLKKLLHDEVKPMDLYSDFYSQIYEYMVSSDTYDRDIYLEAVKGGKKKNILEFACGSGRIMLPLVMHGHAVTGVELSKDMIKLLNDKIRYVEPGVQKLIRIFQGDMAEVNVNEKFDIIILGACTLSLLHTLERRKAFIENVVRHLLPGGLFIFDYQIIDNEKVAKNPEHIQLIPISTVYPKHFMLMGEKVFAEENSSLLNLYNEIVEEKGRTTRYLGKTRKAILENDDIRQLIEQGGLKITASFSQPAYQDVFYKEHYYLFCQLSDTGREDKK
jgi:SAM-dependent methyltransferase